MDFGIIFIVIIAKRINVCIIIKNYRVNVELDTNDYNYVQ